MSKPAVLIPPLKKGNRLSRAEFEWRYQAMPQVKKAELIKGIVYMSSPVRAKHHANPHSRIITWLGNYEIMTPGVESYDNATVRLDEESEPQPDVLLRLPENMGGKSRITKDDYIEGAPELIVEISASSASYDLHEKRQIYLRNGVQEYVVWRIEDQCLDWFVLKDNKYVALLPNSEGIIQSQVFPGLVLAVPALLSGDFATVLTTLQKSMQTFEYQDFVEYLSSLEENRE